MAVTVSPREAIAHPPAANARIADKLAWAVNFAVLAPSKHNTQPWYFEVERDGVDMHADGARALVTSDPTGREMLIGCGAALANLRLGIRALGFEPVVRLFPQGEGLSYLARVSFGEPRAVTADEQRLVDAVPRRHTQRLPLNGALVDRELLVELQDAAMRAGGKLYFVETPGALSGVSRLVAMADRTEHWDPARQEELRQWVRTEAEPASDGIPAGNVGLGAAAAQRPFPIRNFDVRGAARPRPDAVEDDPVVALLWTARDDAVGWLGAGQAAQMVLLRACVSDVQASFLNQPIEDAALRPLLAEELGIRGFPQMLLRLGWGAGAPATPRRPAEDVTEIHLDSASQ